MTILGTLSSGGLAPGAPTIGTATDGGTGTTASVAFTVPAWKGKGTGTVTYTATSSPGNLTGTGTSSPITVSGLTTGTAYTFTVKATTSYGVTGPSSAASNSVTPASPTSFESIATATSGGTSYTFSNIPQTYKHLQIRITAFSGQSYIPRFQFNGETASYYYYASVSGTRESGTNFVRNTWSNATGSIIATNTIGLDSTLPTVGVFNILDYTNSSKKPNMTGLSGQNTNRTSYNWVQVTGSVFNFSNGAALTSIRVFLDSNSFTTGSRIALYGIK